MNWYYVEVPFHFSDEVTVVQNLMKKYQSVPMSFADACLVRMSELIPGSSLLTLDSDFRIYSRRKKEEGRRKKEEGKVLRCLT
ncbi:MAG: hypothetical protein SWX82_28640 [Cyanobacteriota bacterium]|nr:hypothetical protein [Cyanobacteriota bacterium]